VHLGKFPVVRGTLFCMRCSLKRWVSAASSEEDPRALWWRRFEHAGDECTNTVEPGEGAGVEVNVPYTTDTLPTPIGSFPISVSPFSRVTNSSTLMMEAVVLVES
jgi:hypothetical protein